MSCPASAGPSATGFLCDVDAGRVPRDASAAAHAAARAGLFVTAPLVRLNLDVGNDLDGHTRLHFSTGFSF
jgi:hypothetical protein